MINNPMTRWSRWYDYFVWWPMKFENNRGRKWIWLKTVEVRRSMLFVEYRLKEEDLK